MPMAVKATLLDSENTPHLLIGLNWDDVEAIQRGDFLMLPSGQNMPLSETSNIMVIFEDSDEALVQRIKSKVRTDEMSGM